MSLVLRHAMRDLRGGIRHLRLLLVCLALGVAVMSCIGSMIAGLRAGIDRDARSLLGGDIEIHQLYEKFPDDVLYWLRFNSEGLSSQSVMRAMAEHDQNSTLVELKGVDDAYPLYGSLEFTKGGKPIARKDVLFSDEEHRRYGVAVERSLLTSLHMHMGEVFFIGPFQFQIRGVIAHEPDRGVNTLSLGPRVMVNSDVFDAEGFLPPGSMINYRQLLRLKPGTDLAAWKRTLAAAYPKAHWNMRDWHDSAPGLVTLIDRMSLFFALTGITTLIVAGIGIGNASNVYMWSKRHTIATLKCLGASERHVRGVYLVQLLLTGLCAIAAGVAIGTVAETLLFGYLDTLLPVSGERGVYWLPSALSAGLGVLTLLLLALWPLQQAARIKPLVLFRGDALPSAVKQRGGGVFYALHFLLICAMLALAIVFTGTVRIPVYFTAGLLLALAMFSGIGAAIKSFARRSAHKGYRITLSMALANLARPGAATTSMVIALGIGMTLLVTLTLVGQNLRGQLEKGLPEHAPAFFLLDIQTRELNGLMAQLHAIGSVEKAASLPIVRGRIIELNHTPVARLSIDQNARWALQGDRGLTFAATPPDNTVMAQGAWWDKDYNGPPLVSFDINLARGMGLKIGDTITIAALDKEITATISNLRDIQWGSMEMNFAIILSPGALDGLPITYLATVSTPPDGEKAVQLMLMERFPQVAVVHVREALGSLSAMLSQISTAVLVTAAMTIVCGVLVMASAVHASLHKRMYDTVMLKVLGVTRGRILRIYLAEFALVALSAALVSVALGVGAAYGVMQLMIFSGFHVMPSVIFATIAFSLLLAIGLGLVATHIALKVRPLTLLRNE
jgi:putative ABC transport system permease protein